MTQATQSAVPGASLHDRLDDDLERCATLLPRVSRSFALSIAALPPELRDAVGVAYLLCRALDTIEDTPGVSIEVRRVLFDELTTLFVDDRRPVEPVAKRCATELRRACEAERDLCGEALPALIRIYRSLPPVVREAMVPSLLEMARGMRLHAEQASAQGGLRFLTLEALERYCYFVAGTVGELLFRLFVLHTGLPATALPATRPDDAISFGVGLQLVNVVKDIAADLERADCFVPTDLLAAEGLRAEQLLDPAHREAAMRVVRRLTARARERLGAAARFTQSWPLPTGLPVRAFCAVPLALAWLTLARTEQGEETLRKGVTPKVDRATVAKLWSEAQWAVADDERLRAWLCGLAG